MFLCVTKWRKSSISNVRHFLGENDIIASRVRWDLKRASLSPRSKTTQQDCFSRCFFLSRSKKDDESARRTERCESTHRERNRNEFEAREAESVHAGRRLETPETITRGFETREQRNGDHTKRNNRRDSVFGGIKANFVLTSLSNSLRSCLLSLFGFALTSIEYSFA